MFDAAGASRARFDDAAAEPTPAAELNLSASLVKAKASK
jgi:hypothetical protein